LSTCSSLLYLLIFVKWLDTKKHPRVHGGCLSGLCYLAFPLAISKPFFFNQPRRISVATAKRSKIIPCPTFSERTDAPVAVKIVAITRSDVFCNSDIIFILFNSPGHRPLPRGTHLLSRPNPGWSAGCLPEAPRWHCQRFLGLI